MNDDRQAAWYRWVTRRLLRPQRHQPWRIVATETESPMSKNSIKDRTVKDTSGAMYFIKTDSGVIKSANGEGYSRQMVLSGWDPDDKDRIMKADVHVDRFREKSFARAWVWTDLAGWADMGQLPTTAYWEDMPGYTRGGNPTSVRETARVSGDLATVCRLLVEDGGI